MRRAWLTNRAQPAALAAALLRCKSHQASEVLCSGNHRARIGRHQNSVYASDAAKHCFVSLTVPRDVIHVLQELWRLSRDEEVGSAMVARLRHGGRLALALLALLQDSQLGGLLTG